MSQFVNHAAYFRNFVTKLIYVFELSMIIIYCQHKPPDILGILFLEWGCN